MAQNEGQEVLFSQPHYSDLQPIETVWAIVKGEVGRQYTTETTFSVVLDRLKASFDRLQSTTVQGCINQANDKLNKLLQDLQLFDDQDPSDDNDDDVSSSSSIGRNSDDD